MKMRNKLKITISVTLIFIIILTTAFVGLYKKAVHWQEQAANYNIGHWSELYILTSEFEELGVTQQTVKELQLYSNGIVYTSTANLMPPVNGGSTYTAFLRCYYDQFIQDLAREGDEMTEQQLNEGLQLLKEMNTSLNKLCNEILLSAEDKTNKIDLMKPDSKLYKEFDEKINDFCNKYGKKIFEFNRKHQ